MELSYNGRDYNGWQLQKNGISVQEVIEDKLSKLLKTYIKIYGAGRTDCGVHAFKMFAHFDSKYPLNLKEIRRINYFLPKTIKVSRLSPVRENAHARFDAISRTYQYHISFDKAKIGGSLWFKSPLDIKKMNKATDILKKYEDFSSFCKLIENNKKRTCKIYRAQWFKRKKSLFFIIEANSFLRNMVRAIVGTLIEVGIGKIDLSDFSKIIEAKDRRFAGNSAPASGLSLKRIRYPEDIFL
ncbi:MAG TPA: tRNA pseudouridine(38-40) synthase TruA [Candidatus Angelobacter sp.]|jgi:tRNA pseudouridine38-40 synthase|nr:tRNA pseudouridine(38-40) synthase TruA [Candidatus Angelobacter sp.]